MVDSARVDFTIHEYFSSPSPVKRTRDDNLLTPVEEGSSKKVLLSECTEQEALTPFFRHPTILISRIPNTPEEFVVVLATNYLAFVRGLSASDRRGLFSKTSCTCLGFDP